MIKKLLTIAVLIYANCTYGLTVSKNIPKGFLWGYTMDLVESTPRAKSSGNFWKDALFLENQIILLNTYQVICLDYKGKTIWTHDLPIPTQAYAKIHLYPNFIVILTPSRIMTIDKKNGEEIQIYNLYSSKASIIEKRTLEPQNSFIWNKELYVFLGSELLAFNPDSLTRRSVKTFYALLKTTPILFKDEWLILGFQNGFAILFNLRTKKHKTLLEGASERDFSIRQPAIYKNKIIIPTNEKVFLFEEENMIQEKNAEDLIVSVIKDKIWVRKHKSPYLLEWNEKFKTTQKLIFTKADEARLISTPLVGHKNILLHTDGIDGKIFIIEDSPLLYVKETFLSEDFSDNPPLYILKQENNLVLLAAFDGVYLIDLNLYDIRD